jgi:DNA-binding transcriptional LysR family regulator
MADYKEYVYAVYKEKGFSKAAQKLFISQPWLSAVVKKEEERIGVPIFDRSSKPVSLTPEGKYYIDKIEQIMQLEKDLENHFKELRQHGHKEIHIGSSMFFCTYVLPRLMEDFQGQHPDVTFTFTEGEPEGLTHKLMTGEIDLILEAEKTDSPDLESQPWRSEELVMAVPAADSINKKLRPYCYDFASFLKRRQPGCAKPRVPLKKFAKASFLFLKEGNDSHDRSQAMCREAGFEPQVEMYVTQMMTAYYLVCEGRGIAFLRSAIPESVSPTSSVCFYQIDSELAMRDIYLTYMTHRTNPLIDALLEDLMKDTVGVF